MHISRIPPDRITARRLDADFYHPEYLDIDAKLLAHKHIRFGSCGRFFAGPFGSKLPSDLYLSTGIPLFRVGNIGQFDVNVENLAHLDEGVHDELRASEVVPGDLLVVKASVGEKLCKVPDWIPRANITQHIIAVRPNGKVDTDYVSAFLFSRYGRKQLERYALGSIIQYLGVADARAVLVLGLDTRSQAYIGEKIRQAERLRVRAAHLGCDAESAFGEAISWQRWAGKFRKFERVRANEIGLRLDLKYNSPQRINLTRHFSTVGVKAQALSELTDISAMIGWKGLTTEHYRNEGPWLLRGTEFSCGVIDVAALVSVDEEKYLEQPQIHLREGDIALTKDGTLGRAIVIPKLHNRIAAASTVARLRIKKSANVDPHYLEFALNHACCQIQVESFATGIAQPHITQEWIALLDVPRIDAEERVARAWRSHHACLITARQCIEAARLLVESLIEAQLHESDLIAAQQALEAGDDSLDRAILARLKTDGIDGTSEPLFPDLDQLYDLLGRAAREAVPNGT